jgi:hypothetical protein
MLPRRKSLDYPRRLDPIVAAVICVLTVGLCIRYDAILFGDYADHLARAVVMDDLLFHHGAQFGAVFQFHAMPIPYLLGDLLLASIVGVLGVAAATAVWTTLALLALPLAALWYVRATHADSRIRAPLFIVCLYCSLDWFYIAGFMNFRLAVAMVVAAFACVQSLRVRWSNGLYAAYVCMVVLGYLMHLSFVVFLGTAIGASGAQRLWLRSIAWRRETCFAAPLLVVIAWHAIHVQVFPQASEVVTGHWNWGSLALKLKHLDWGFVRFDAPLDWMIAIGMVAVPLLALARSEASRTVNRSAAAGMLVLVAAFLLTYAALPMRAGDITYIDIRALALAVPCAMAAPLMLLAPAAIGDARVRLCVLLGVSTLAIAELVGVGAHLAPWQAWLAEYRALTLAVPAGADVLPVYTRPLENRWRPFNHAAALAVLVDRGAIVPNLFSGDRGQPMKYFRYVQRRYEPDGGWYVHRMPGMVDWNAVACDHDFLLMTSPYELARIGVEYEVAARNSSGVLLKVVHRQCGCAGGKGNQPARAVGNSSAAADRSASVRVSGSASPTASANSLPGATQVLTVASKAASSRNSSRNGCGRPMQ